MRKVWTLLIFSLIFCTILLPLSLEVPVLALGAPTDNTTAPNVPTGDQSQAEIKPSVEYVLLEPTLQSSTAPPHFITAFVTPSGETASTVTGDENWYIDVDINSAGWIYIYEYFPPEKAAQGQWITYKWQLPESGVWRFGPLAPSAHEAEGQHIYRVWFYSSGQWATGNDMTSQSTLIYWTYTKGLPAEPVPPVFPSVPEDKGFGQKVYEFFTMPAVLAACLAFVIAGLAVPVVYLWRRRRHDNASAIEAAGRDELSTELPPASARARITLPNGIEIPLFEDSKVIGRADLARLLDLDDLDLVSRQHFEIKSADGRFYIEDLSSANGTSLNGRDISGEGPVGLNDNDTIEPAGAAPLKFHIV
jgi:hypothetical protein